MKGKPYFYFITILRFITERFVNFLKQENIQKIEIKTYAYGNSCNFPVGEFT